MAEKTIKTRIINKHGALKDWIDSKTVLKEGEIALAYVETTKPDGQGGTYTVPTYLMKVGDGTNTFSGLEWVAAPASDVYAWAKKASLALSDIPMAAVKTDLQDTFYTEVEVNALLAEKSDNHDHPYAPSSHTHGNITNGGALDTASRVVITDANKKITTSDITTEELGRLDGVTSNIQTQLDGKAAKATTLAGYGITDSYTKLESDALLAKKSNIHDHPYAPEVHNHDDRYYTKDEIVEKLSSVLEYKGTKNTTADLPTSGQVKGDVWNISNACNANSDKNLPAVNAGDNVAWNGTGWDVLAGTVDLSSYTTKTYVDSELAKKVDPEDLIHTHATSIAESTGTNQLTLAHDTKYAINAGGTSFVFTMPKDTHYASKTIIGASGTATANAAATNASLYLNHIENSKVTSSHKIVGSGATSVSSDANGVLTITSTDTKVTSVGNHYAPTADSTKQLSVGASSTTKATWGSTSLVTGVNLQRDAAGHVTGVTVDSIQMPTNPDSHYTTKIYAGASGTATNAATTNPYVKVVDDTTYRNQIRLIGADSGNGTKVTSDASGNITIEALPATNDAGEIMTYIFDCGGPND